MPGMDGLETTQKIRQLLSKYSVDQPIITAITGNQDERLVREAISSGIN